MNAELIEAFKTTPTAVISDNLERLPGAVGLRPFHKSGSLAGPAFTVRVCAGDNLFIHKALDLVEPGAVIVVDGGGDTSRALIGEIIVTIAKARKVAGFVVDGAIRDVGAIAKDNFPCFARGVIHLGPYKNGPGEIGVPVTIGGMIVNPGDLVVGDEDGVVAFPASRAEEILKLVRGQERREEAIMKSVADGTYAGAYAKPAQT